MRGCVDHLTPGKVSGWVFDPAVGIGKMQVRVTLGPRVLVEGLADLPRPGVGQIFGTDGRHGFQFAGLTLSPRDIAGVTVEVRSLPGAAWQALRRRPGLRPAAPRGSGGMKVTVIGASHVEALRYALPPGQDRIEIINIGRRRAGVPHLTPTEWRDAPEDFRALFRETLSPDRHFVSMLGGNDHNAIGLLEHPQRYDLVEPGEEAPELEVGRALIPYDAMRALLEQRLAPYLRWIAELAPVFAGRKLHLCSPPPVPSDAHIRSFPGRFKLTARRGVAPARIRAKLHRLNSDIFRAGCSELGMTFLPPPAEATDAAGFLEPTYWNQDPTHANVHYGSLLLKQIEEHVAA